MFKLVFECSDLDSIMEMIEEGTPENEIRLAYPSQFFRYYRNINQMRQVYLETKYGDMFRDVDITYIYGNSLNMQHDAQTICEKELTEKGIAIINIDIPDMDEQLGNMS